MNVRLKKEFRGYLWPWLATALIGLLPLISWTLPASLLDQSFNSIYVFAGAGFVFGTALLTTLPFGEEFSLRTMPVLLCQPVTRWQLWSEKLKITLWLTVTIACLNVVGVLPLWGLVGNQLKLALAFFIFTISSGGFWVLLTRSTIGGIVLCLFTQAVITITAYAFTQARYFDIGIWDSSKDTQGILLKVSLLLSPVFLWLGWKLFSRLQDTETSSSEISLLAVSSNRRTSSTSWLCASPTSPRLNLLLKELVHYRPLLPMACLFSTLWIGMLLLNTIFPTKHALLGDILDAVLAVYATLVFVIAGCISLAEEKGMGLHASNLTLPVSWKTQLLLKLGLSLMVGSACAVLIPWLLTQYEASITSYPLTTTIKGLQHDLPAMAALCLMAASFIVASFWSATVTNRTIHAVFLAGFTILLAAVFHTMGKNIQHASGYYTTYHLDWITAYLHLAPGWASDYSNEIFHLSLAIIGLPFLALSWYCYRNHTPQKIIITKAIILTITLSWLSGMSYTDILKSSQNQRLETSPFFRETRAALHAFKADIWNEKLPTNVTLRCPSEYLAGTGKLSPLTAKWLDGFTIRVEQSTYMWKPDQPFHLINAYIERDSDRRYLPFRTLLFQQIPVRRVQISSDSKK